MFTYRGRRRLFGRGVGIGQVLGVDREQHVVFVELFAARDDELVPFIGFLPITYRAFQQSEPEIAKVLAVSTRWEERRDIWLSKWRSGDAGVFSVDLRDAVATIVKTVSRDRELDDGKIFIEVAFPRRDTSGAFRTVEAHVDELA
jgi:hypothetical protein